jgi:hypothetical protein
MHNQAVHAIGGGRRSVTAIVVHEKMKYGIAILFLCLAGCAGRTHLPEPATHWTRSDDFGEYHGLYVFSQTPDGKLWGIGVSPQEYRLQPMRSHAIFATWQDICESSFLERSTTSPAEW